MKRLLVLFTLITSMAFLGKINAQILYTGDNCTYYHQDNCPIPDFSFYYNGQSKSALFKRGQTSELHIVVYEGEDYFVSVCAPKRWQPVRLRIMEDDEDKTVLFDNKKQNYVDTVKFSNKVTKRLILEVSTPPMDETDEKEDPDETRCVGVLIASRRTKQSKFVPTDDNTGF